MGLKSLIKVAEGKNAANVTFEDKFIKEYEAAYSSLKPKAAAAIFEAMTDNLDLAVRILGVMDADARGKILAVMDAEIAARITKLMDPES